MRAASFSLNDCPNAELLAGAQRCAGHERESTAFLIAYLAGIDTRRLYLEQGCSSLFKYCVEVLHLSESSAYRRIEAARIARRFPIVFELLSEGAIHLTTVMVLGPSLTEENHRELLEAARHKSKEDVERLAVSIRPQPAVPAVIRKLPERVVPGPELGFVEVGSEPVKDGVSSPGSVVVAAPRDEILIEPAAGPVRAVPSRKPVVSPLSPELYKIQFTANAETRRKLRQLQELLRHQIPNGDPAIIIDRALGLLLEQVTREKLGQVKRPRKRGARRRTDGMVEASETAHAVPEERTRESRHIPSEVKRAVWNRDGGRCAFVSRNGRRCSERRRLEFHHVEPYAVGGKATVANIALRCRAHNGYEGEIIFGAVDTKRGTRAGVSRVAAGTRAGASWVAVGTRAGASSIEQAPQAGESRAVPATGVFRNGGTLLPQGNFLFAALFRSGRRP
jgi:hypothetical protein